MPRGRSPIKDEEPMVKLRELPQGGRQEIRMPQKYREWSMKDLYYRAQVVGVKGRSKLSKGELITLRYH